METDDTAIIHSSAFILDGSEIPLDSLTDSPDWPTRVLVQTPTFREGGHGPHLHGTIYHFINTHDPMWGMKYNR